jgi:Spy/CpxP family protein refolding chaperone
MLLTRKKCPALLLSLASLLCLATAVPSFAQDWHGPDHGPGNAPMERAFHGGHGRWWNNPRLAQQVGLTDEQKKKMDAIFEQHRLQLVDLNAALEKDEILLHPLIEADQLDEQKVLNQIDAVAQARANLEKAHARMLFDIRKVLTPDQWKKLQTIVREHHEQMGEGGDHRGWGGPDHGDWHRPGGPQGPDGGPSNPPPTPNPGGSPQQAPPQM